MTPEPQPERTRILFVDDEVRVLDAFAALMRKRRSIWDMEFALGGQAALDLLAERSFDVVVTDLRMPDVDGFQILDELCARHPHTVRISLSGDPHHETAVRVVPNAHRVLTKPCRSEDLEAAVAAARTLQGLVADDAVRSAIGRVKQLPVLPRTYTQLTEVMQDERAGAREIAAVLEKDIGISAKVLQVANSSLFSRGDAVSNVAHAVNRLGTDNLRTLVLSSAMFDRPFPPSVQRFAEELHRHSLLVARVASEVSPDPETRRDAFAAGVLHDVGRLVIALEMPAAPKESTTLVLGGDPFDRSVSGAGHARVGAYLLGLWGLPLPVIAAVSEHHEPLERLTSPVTRSVREAEAIVLAGGASPSEDAVAEMIATAKRRRQESRHE